MLIFIPVVFKLKGLMNRAFVLGGKFSVNLFFMGKNEIISELCPWVFP